MFVRNVAINHFHDANFFQERPHGSGDYLMLVLKSNAIFNINERDISIPKNTVFLYNLGTPQYYRAIGNSFSHDWIHFHFENDELSDFMRLNIPFDTPINMKNINHISFCLKCISYENYSDNKYKKDTVNYYMKIIFNKISEFVNEKNTINKSSHYTMLSTIRSKVQHHPYENINAESLAHEISMSKSYFQHLYKKHFGVSLIEDLINSRIEYAKWHLAETDFSVKSISELCGYNNFSHFERQFKEKTGITPTEYRSNILVKVDKEPVEK